jgi:hypothetical protein
MRLHCPGLAHARKLAECFHVLLCFRADVNFVIRLSSPRISIGPAASDWCWCDRVSLFTAPNFCAKTFKLTNTNTRSFKFK